MYNFWEFLNFLNFLKSDTKIAFSRRAEPCQDPVDARVRMTLIILGCEQIPSLIVSKLRVELIVDKSVKLIS